MNNLKERQYLLKHIPPPLIVTLSTLDTALSTVLSLPLWIITTCSSLASLTNPSMNFIWSRIITPTASIHHIIPNVPKAPPAQFSTAQFISPYLSIISPSCAHSLHSVALPPHFWNSLPHFISQLKTHLFKAAYSTLCQSLCLFLLFSFFIFIVVTFLMSLIYCCTHPWVQSKAPLNKIYYYYYN